MPKFMDDEGGPIWVGCFFELDFSSNGQPQDGCFCIPCQGDEGWDDDDYAYGEVISECHRKIYECPLDPTHETRSVLTKLEVRLHGGFLGPIIPAWPHLLVRNDIANRLRNSPLRGFDLVPVEVQGEGASEDFVAVAYLGPAIERARVFSPPGSNHCFYCNYGPIICPACETAAPHCPRCAMRCTEYKTDDRNDRIVITPVPDTGVVIDAARFDGADFFATRSTYVVSSRVVRFFQSLAAGPLVARSLRTYVGSCTEPQLAEIAVLRANGAELHGESL